MKKIQLIETVIDWLASDAAGDSKGVYHPEIVKQHLNNVFNQAIYNTWLNGKKYNDLGQLDAWSRTYPCSVVGQTGTTSYAFLPFAPVQLPDNAGIRQVCDNADNSNVFAPIEATANVVFAELEVSTMDDTPTYRLEQNNQFTGAGELSHKLILEKQPVAPSTLIIAVDVMMIVPLEVLDDYDDVACPSSAEENLITQVIELMSKKPMPDTNNDMVIQK
jgi:hypothetical protein